MEDKWLWFMAGVMLGAWLVVVIMGVITVVGGKKRGS